MLYAVEGIEGNSYSCPSNLGQKVPELDLTRRLVTQREQRPDQVSISIAEVH